MGVALGEGWKKTPGGIVFYEKKQDEASPKNHDEKVNSMPPNIHVEIVWRYHKNLQNCIEAIFRDGGTLIRVSSIAESPSGQEWTVTYKAKSKVTYCALT